MKRSAVEVEGGHSAVEGGKVEFITEWPPPSAAAVEHTSLLPANPAKVLRVGSNCSGGSSSSSSSSDDDPRADRDAEADAAVALAKFWRQGTIPRQAAPGHIVLSSSSRIALLARSAAGRKFLEQRAANLRRLAEPPSRRQAALLHALASVLNYLGDVRSALQACTRATTLSPRKRQYEWLRLKLERFAAARDAAVSSWPAACPVGCPFRTVQRLHCSELTCRQFFEEFSMKRRPVIITGLQVTCQPWSADVIERAAGALQVDVKTVRADSCEWAGLEVHRTTSVSEFIRSLGSGVDDVGSCTEQGYLFDWPLAQHCPALASQLIIPRYFARDLLQKLPDGCMYKDSWPSLFIAPAGISCGTHVDAFASNFWMAVLQGTKRWTIWDAAAMPLLNPDYTSGFDPVFPDVNEGKFLGHERSAAACPYDFLLHAGEVLFVPHGCPHRVCNRSSSIAISANFCDGSNIGAAVKELDIAALVGGEAQARVASELRAVMCSAEQPLGSVEEGRDLPWEQFKMQSR